MPATLHNREFLASKAVRLLRARERCGSIAAPIRHLSFIFMAVLRHPLTTFPKPAYFASHKSLDKLMPRMTALEEKQAFSKVPGVLAAAMRS